MRNNGWNLVKRIAAVAIIAGASLGVIPAANAAAPAVPVFTAPASGDWYAVHNPNFSGTAEAGSTVNVRAGKSTTSTPICTVKAGTDGSWTCRSTVNLGVGGGQWATGTATNADGTSGPAYIYFGVAGGSVINSPTAGETVTTATPTFTGGFSGGGHLNLRDELGRELCMSMPFPGGAWTCTSPVQFANGTHTVTAQNDDNYGNSGDSSSVTFTVDVPTPPAAPTSDVEVTYSAGAPTYDLGGDVEYTVVLENTGAADATGFLLDIDLSDVEDDGPAWPEGEASDGTLSLHNSKLKWSGDIAAGDKVEITFSVGAWAYGNGKLTSKVVASSGNCKAGSTDSRCSTKVLVPQVKVVKTASPSYASPGDTVRYTVTATNISSVPTNELAVDDYLSGIPGGSGSVTKLATYNKDAKVSTGEVAADPYDDDSPDTVVLGWSSGSLAPGKSATMTYSVKVGSSNGKLVNYYEGMGYPACPIPVVIGVVGGIDETWVPDIGPDPRDCTTTVSIGPKQTSSTSPTSSSPALTANPLPATGLPLTPALPLTLGLLLAGAFLVALTRART